MALTTEEQRIFISLLRKLGRPYPPEVFYAISECLVTNPIELVPITLGGDVLLFRRLPDDPYYANLWSSPGSIYLKGDTVNGVLTRLLGDDLAGITCHTLRPPTTEWPYGIPEFVDYCETPKGEGPGQSPRSHMLKLVFVTYVQGDNPGTGRFFSLWDLPKDLVEGQRGFLSIIRDRYFPSRKPTALLV